MPAARCSISIGPAAATIALAVLSPLVPGAGEAAGQVTFTERTTSDGAIGLTISNYGRLGNDFRDRSSSFEFPLGGLGEDRQDEHMTRGGIWIGGLVLDSTGGLDSLVSTAVVDIRVGAAPGTGTEFTPRRDPLWPTTDDIWERSRQPNDPSYYQGAIADQEFVCLCDDEVPIPDPNDPHVPLHVKVRLTSLVWAFAPFDGIVFLNYEVTNVSPSADIFDLYVGFYAELTTGNKAAATLWPPGQAWFETKDIAWVDSLRLVTEHRVPISGDSFFADTWCGAMLLGARPGHVDSLGAAFNWWDWDPESPDRSADRQRYALLANGEVDDASGNEYQAQEDPVILISTGPFEILGASEVDTVRFSVAMVGGLNETDLIAHAAVAQDAWDKGFRIPVPPTVPAYLVQPGPHEITLRWDDSSERAIDPETGEADFEGYRVYVSRTGTTADFDLIKEADIVDDYQFDPTQEDIRFNTGLGSLVAGDPLTVITEGDTLVYRYKYVIRNLRDGFKHWTALTAFDRGTQEIGPLESGVRQTRTLAIPGTPPPTAQDGPPPVSVFPNPYHGTAEWDGAQVRDRYLWFTNLPRRCTIRIYTLAGDLVDTIEFDGDRYDARDIRGIYDPTDPRNPESDLPVLPGGMAAWDLITRRDQAVATGLYLFSVEDHGSGERQVGKFMVIK